MANIVSKWAHLIAIGANETVIALALGKAAVPVAVAIRAALSERKVGRLANWRRTILFAHWSIIVRIAKA